MKPSDIIEFDQMFLPSQSTGVISSLCAAYEAEKVKIEGFIAGLTDEYRNILHHFERPGKVIPGFNIDSAIISLNASYWTRALNLTNVFELMPQKRKDQWHKQLGAWRDDRYVFGKNPEEDLPAFEEETVRSTLESLLSQRELFFAERVDGIFRQLSRTHVTNQSEGFSKRLIVAGVINDWGSTDWSKVGYIADLRQIIAKFMGRDDPARGSTDFIIKQTNQNGQWLSFDAGALRIRTYKVGTAHLEIHPEMAWRLNSVLASLYPMAIPSKFRTKPTKKHKEFELMQRPLPFAVLALLQEGDYWHLGNYKRQYSRSYESYEKTLNSFEFRYSARDKRFAMDEAYGVLEAIGGVRQKDIVVFDYDAREIINSIIVTGCIPEYKSHQYYSTPSELAQRAVALAEINDDDTCLEPSAGTAGIADYMPKDLTLCVEISKLHCDVLEAKGFKVVNDDFLAYKPETKFNVVVANPPFADGRAKAHVEHALTMLAPKGRLVAILPASFAGKSFNSNGKETWSDPIDNAFKNASVLVILYKFESN